MKSQGKYLFSPERSLSPLRIIALVCGVAVVSYLTARLGGTLVLRPQMMWPLWPGNAFLVSVLLLTPRKIWPALIVAGLGGFALYDLQEGLPFRAMALLLIADAIEVVIAAEGPRLAFGGMPRLNSLKSLALYSLFAVVVAPVAVASSAANALKEDSWWVGFFTEALALLTLTPAILSWAELAKRRTKKPKEYYLEAAVMYLCLGIVAYWTFVEFGSQNRPVLLYSLVPFLLWAALRFGIAGTSTSVVLVAYLAILGAVQGRGPFKSDSPVHSVLSLQLFLLVAGGSFMVLAAAVEEYRSAEQAARESEKRFRSVADTAPVLIWMSGTDKLCTYFNKPWLDFTGESLEQQLGNGWLRGVHPSDLQRCLDTYTHSFETRDKFRMEYRLRRHDGEYRWILDIGVPRYNEDLSFAGYIGSCLDVTERKQAEQALSVSEERLRLAQTAAGIGSFEWNIQTGANTWTPELEAIYGLPQGGFSGTQLAFERLVHPKDLPALLESIRRTMETGQPAEGEWRVVWSDGSVHWVAGRWRIFKDSAGQPQRMVGVNIDITERKRAERALAESEERLRLAAHAGRMFAYSWNVSTDVIERSGESADILGVAKDEVATGTGIARMVYPDDREAIEAALAELRPENPTLQITHRFIRPDGTVIWLERNSRGYFDENGRLARVVGMVADVTERTKAEQALADVSRKLVEAQEQERSRIARELHDDINQRLAILAVGLQDATENPSDVHEIVQELREQTIEIAGDVQALSHELHSSKLEYMGAIAAMKSWCHEIAGRHKMDILFSSEVSGALPREVGLSLYRVLQEALHNAVKHSGTRRVEVTVTEDAREVLLVVRDAGRGFDIDQARQSRGLGLTSMQERVRIVNGTLSIQSKPEGGTSIHVRVPLKANLGRAHAVERA